MRPSARARSSPRDRPSCRSRRGRATAPSSIRPGDVALRRDGVDVAREEDERRPAARRRVEERLVARRSERRAGRRRTSGRDARASCRHSDGMSTSSSVRAASRARAPGTGAYRGIIRRMMIPSRSAAGAEPERGSSSRCCRRGPTPRTSSPSSGSSRGPRASSRSASSSSTARGPTRAPTSARASSRS